mgnify:CR=1 FL=1
MTQDASGRVSTRERGQSPAVPQVACKAGGNYAGVRQTVVSAILKAVSEQTGFELSVIMSTNRTQPVSDARHMAMALIKEYYPRMTDAQIGSFLGRGQSDVCYGRAAVSRRCAYSKGYRMMFEFIRQSVKQQIGALQTPSPGHLPAKCG